MILIFFTKLIVVTKNQQLDSINFLIKAHHFDFGENRVQEAYLKWKNLISTNSQLKLHLIGKLQSNKVDDTYDFFDFIHSVDSKKVAIRIFENEKKFKKNIPLFVQVNIGREDQKGGIAIEATKDFV